MTSTLTLLLGKHTLIGRLLDYYTDQEFIKSDETMDTTANVDIITDISIKEYGLELGNHNMQVLKDDVYIYPSDYFCPKITVQAKYV